MADGSWLINDFPTPSIEDMSLQKFGDVLLLHIVQEEKAPLTTVVSHFEDWVMEKQKQQEELDKEEEIYKTRHENPRHTRWMMYQQYMKEQEEAFLRYQNTSSSKEKLAALHAYLRILPPQELRKEGVSHDFVYTQNRVSL